MRAKMSSNKQLQLLNLGQTMPGLRCLTWRHKNSLKPWTRPAQLIFYSSGVGNFKQWE